MNEERLGTDRKTFEEGSAVRERLVAYGGLVGELYVVIFTRKGFAPQQLAPNVWAYPTNSRSRFFYIRDAKRIAAKLISERKFQAADTILSVQDPFETGLVGVFLKKHFKLGLQVQVHTDFLSPYFWRHSLLNFVRTFIAWRVLPRADQVRVVSERIARSLAPHLSPVERAKIAVLPIHTDTARFAAAPAINLGEKYPQFSDIILMASRLASEKDIVLALRAFKNVLVDFPTVGLLIVGDGPQKARLEHLAAALGINESVLFEPWTRDIVSYYKTADLFLSTSRYEGYGLSLVEAALAGLPIVTSDVGIAGELVRDGESARVYPVGSEARCAAALKETLALSSVDREKLASAARERVEKNVIFEEHYLGEYKKLFEKTLATTRQKRLLIITQSVDLNNPILGFFHRWIEEFAKHCQHVTVICLEKGKYDLPVNVRVLSLGKEQKKSRLQYVSRFYSYLFKYRKEYDAVFVHMNPEYVILGGALWRLWNKKSVLWYTHKAVSAKLRFAVMLINKALTASAESFRLPTKKLRIVGHGIDTVFFSPDLNIKRGEWWLSVGRLMPSKRHDVAIREAAQSHKELHIAGDGPEKQKLETLAAKLKARVTFLGSLTQTQMRDAYRRAALLIHRSTTGSLDKVVLEAAACGLPVDTTDPALARLPLTPQYVQEHHSLANFIPCILQEIYE